MGVTKVAVQFLALVLIISLGTGCGSGTTHTATPPVATSSGVTTQTATPDPLLAVFQNALVGLRPGDFQPLNRAEQDATDLLREQSGARAAFGDQADAIFQRIDQAKASAIRDLFNKMGGTSGITPTPEQGMALTGLLNTLGISALPSMDYQIVTPMLSLGLLLASSVLLDNAPRDASGNATLPRQEDVRTTENDVAIYTSFTPRIIGSRLEGEAEMTISVTTPIAYEETATDTLSMELCPDAQGEVPLKFTFRTSSNSNNGGLQMGGDTQATGYVNDEADLTSYDLQSTSSAAHQPGLGVPNGTPNQFVEANLNVHLSLTNPGDTTMRENFTRASSQADWNSAVNIASTLEILNANMASVSLILASLKWKDGYCLELTVPELPDGKKTVQPNSDTQFTAHVRHKWENTELPLPVIATLSNGQVSVNPAGIKVPAPAGFTYKAADQEAQSATVNLETRSKRGIAKLDVKFITRLPSWTGEGTYRKSVVNSGMEVKYAYTFSITFHVLPDGTIEGTGTLEMVDWSQKGQGLVCKDSTISSLIYPPMQVNGTFKPAVADQQGKFQLGIVSQSSTNTSYWICTGPGGMSLQGPPSADLGPTMVFDIAATDSAQANGVQDLSGYGNTGSAAWELQIHQQATP